VRFPPRKNEVGLDGEHRLRSRRLVRENRWSWVRLSKAVGERTVGEGRTHDPVPEPEREHELGRGGLDRHDPLRRFLHRYREPTVVDRDRVLPAGGFIRACRRGLARGGGGGTGGQQRERAERRGGQGSRTGEFHKGTKKSRIVVIPVSPGELAARSSRGARSTARFGVRAPS